MKSTLILFLLSLEILNAQTIINPEPLLKDDSVNLFAFIGEKISVLRFNPNEGWEKPIRIEVDAKTGDTVLVRGPYIMDNGFYAKYKVLLRVFNDLKFDTVVFEAYDHYGRPGFENHNPVLLYISKSTEGNSYYHQKYQFDPLFKNSYGRWVGKNGESLQELFELKKETVFTARGLFKP